MMSADFMRKAIEDLKYYAAAGTSPMSDSQREAMVNAINNVVFEKGPPPDLNATEALNRIRRDGGIVQRLIDGNAYPGDEESVLAREALIQELDNYLEAGGTLPRQWEWAKN